MAGRLKYVNHTVSRLKAADLLLLPPFRGRGICFAAIARVEPRESSGGAGGCLKLNYRNIVNLAARVVLRVQLLQALARHLRINLGC